MRRSVFVGCVFLCIFPFASFLWANGIVNPGFELAVEGTDFNTPAGWNVENYATVVNNFVPQHPEAPGSTENWKINLQTGLNPFEGNSFVVLSNGDIHPEPDHAKIWQMVTINIGQKISGAYFYGTRDYFSFPFNDYAAVKLIAPPESNLSDIEVVNISTSDVGNYSSTAGWLTFESTTFTSATAGTYTLECSVYDAGDAIYDSYLAVDGLAVIPEPASIMLLIVGAFISVRQRPNQP